MSDFLALVGDKLTGILNTLGIYAPTPVQVGAIPIAAAKRDLMAQSATGTGKTLAYLLPIFAALNPEIKAVQAVIVAPTFELAAQIAKVAAGIADKPSDVALIIGSANKARQLEALKAKPKIIIGSIGRILEHIAGKKLSVHHVATLVFDEADRLFVPEAMDAIGALIKATQKQRQILLFSASLPEATIKLAMPLTKQAEILRLDEVLPQNISHFYILAEAREKFDILRKVAHALKTPQTIVFVNTPFTIEKVAARLNFHKLSAVPLYGSAQKVKRKEALAAFRASRVNLLVASDIGSRGLDVAGLSHIINLDLPDSEKDYLHRAGRCGRMGRAGTVISIVTPREAAVLEKIANKLGFALAEQTLSHGKLLDKEHVEK